MSQAKDLQKKYKYLILSAKVTGVEKHSKRGRPQTSNATKIIKAIK